jgi:lipopolysaccharide assembly outer membrane protein LptD (OstA)
MKKWVLLPLMAVLLITKGFGQIRQLPTGPDSLKLVIIHNTDRFGYSKSDTGTEIQTLAGNVKLQQGSTLFNCDSAIVNKKNHVIEAFGNVHINDADSVHTYSQYLLYYMDTRIAILKKNVRLTNAKATLLSEELQYDLNQRIGEYHNNGKLINGESVLTSKEGIYYAELKDVIFKQNVHLKDPKYKLRSDSLLYNTETEIATFIAQTYIEDSAKRTITTKEGYYDLKRRKASFGKRPVIKDGAVTVIAEDIDTNDSTGVTILRGNAVYVDTAQGVSVLANFIETNRDEGSFIATQHPLMIIKQDQDSIYVTADTLLSGRLSKLPVVKDSAAITGDSSLVSSDSAVKTISSDTLRSTMVLNTDSTAGKNDSTDRYFKAWHHVRIFSDSLQAVSDSLFYSGKDSIFRLFTDPIIWASANQVTGDTIFLFTKNKKPDQLYVFENGLAINKDSTNLFNQVRGNRLYGYFKDGNIDYFRAKGNAESVYYVKDELQYLVGINRANSDIIDMRFKNKELNRVVFINAVTATMFPVSQATEQDKFLRNFKWRDERRPKTKFELFGN